MNIVSAYSISPSVDAAVSDLQQQFANQESKLVLYFASSAYPHETMAAKMQQAFPSATVVGCSTSGELATGKMLKSSITAMSFNGQAVSDVEVAVVEDVQKDGGVEQAFAGFAQHFGASMLDLNPRRYLGLVLVDGLSGAEEKLIDRIGDLTDVTFIGGSAGDDLKFSATHVYANGKSYQNAAVLALLKPAVEFAFIKTQSFSILPEKLVVTKACEAHREVLEFDNKPAAKAYADALGVSVEEAASRFMHNPVGLVIDDEPFVRSPQQIKGESMLFYCSVVEGMELSILESTDIIEDTRKALEDAKAKLGTLSGIINFNCILRTLELEQRQATEQYAALFCEAPTIGFSTYGEQYIGHINQTATMVVFK